MMKLIWLIGLLIYIVGCALVAYAGSRLMLGIAIGIPIGASMLMTLRVVLYRINRIAEPKRNEL